MCGLGIVTLDDAKTRTGPSPDISHRGVRDLLGSLLEITSDAAQPFSARCWRSAGAVALECAIPKGPRFRVGESWRDGPRFFASAPLLGTFAQEAGSTDTGFRCMRFVDPR